VIEFDDSGKALCHIHEVFRQVDSGDPAGMLRRKVAGGTAKAAADVEQVQIWTQFHLGGQFLCRNNPAKVELVKRSQIGWSKSLEVEARLFECPKDRFFEPSPAVMLCNLGIRTHVHLVGA